MKKLITVLFALVLCFGSLLAEGDSWRLKGHIQMRSELDGRDFSNTTFPRSFTSLKSRLEVEKGIGNDILFFAQIQDSRIFGEEEGTMSSLDNLDFHQAYIKLMDPLGLSMALQVGRFEVTYGTQRFLGAVGWHYIGRSFDGVRMSLDPGFNIDVFALTIREAIRVDEDGDEISPYIGNANPGAYGPYPEGVDSYSMYGFWASNKLNVDHKLDVFGYYEANRNKPIVESVATNDFMIQRATLGLSHYGKYGSNLTSVVEAAVQTGSTGAQDLSAYTVSAIAAYQIGDLNIGAGFDILSGTKPGDADNNSYAASFGTNHKFYGFMDYFINVPRNTNNLGLNDMYVKIKYKPKDSKFAVNLDIHQLMANQKSDDGFQYYGQEIDLTLKYSFIKGTTFTWGNSVMLPDQLMKTIFKTGGVGNQDMAFWSYLMISANIN